MWTRWRCRRCYNNIPAGLRGKYRQAVAVKSGEGSTGSSTSSGEEDKKTLRLRSFGPKLSIIGSRLEEKSKQGKASPPRRESGLEEVW